MKPKDHAKQITQNHGLTERSYYSYKHTLTHYSELMQMELDDLLLEAETEEEAIEKAATEYEAVNYDDMEWVDQDINAWIENR